MCLVIARAASSVAEERKNLIIAQLLNQFGQKSSAAAVAVWKLNKKEYASSLNQRLMTHMIHVLETLSSTHEFLDPSPIFVLRDYDRASQDEHLFLLKTEPESTVRDSKRVSGGGRTCV